VDDSAQFTHHAPVNQLVGMIQSGNLIHTGLQSGDSVRIMKGTVQKVRYRTGRSHRTEARWNETLRAKLNHGRLTREVNDLAAFITES
jgi:hypothetical protein